MMKTKLWIVAVIVTGIVIACSKDLYTTSPQLVFESVNGNRIPSGSYFTFKLQATDKEGDIQDTIWVAKISYDSTVCGNDTIPYQMPSFTPSGDLKAEIDITYAYNFIDNSTPEWVGCTSENGGINDSCYFKFWIHDNAFHTSDTVRSPDIVLLGQ